MTIEDEYLDVLQNIEFAIVSVFREHNDLRDSNVMHSLDALIDLYRAESRGHKLKEYKLPEKETQVFEGVKSMCELRLGRGDLNAQIPDMFGEPKTIEDIIACLRKIRRSVERWNKRGGQQGYLRFVSQFIK
jgi:hypothetical protein